MPNRRTRKARLTDIERQLKRYAKKAKAQDYGDKTVHIKTGTLVNDLDIPRSTFYHVSPKGHLNKKYRSVSTEKHGHITIKPDQYIQEYNKKND